MEDTTLDRLTLAVFHLLRPLVKRLLRHGLSYQQFAEVAKRAYVEVAEHDFALAGRKQTRSRISTITGLSRKEVLRIQELETDNLPHSLRRLNRAERVINGWLQDKDFCGRDGEPLALYLDETLPSFTELVKRYSGDIPPRAIADELARLEIIQTTAGGQLKLIKKAYIPTISEVEQLDLLGEDVADLVRTIDHNIEVGKNSERFFQRKVFYNNLPVESLPELKKRIAERAQACLEEINTVMQQYDRDTNQKVKGSKRIKAGLAMHYFEETIE